MCRVSARRLSIYNFVWRLLKGHQKCIFNTSKVKKTKIHMGSIRQSMQAQPKTIKKNSEHQINQSEQKFYQKKYV
jgi:hypothetical protein